MCLRSDSGLMLALMVSLVAFQKPTKPPEPPPTEAELKSQLARLKQMDNRTARVEALTWLLQKNNGKNAELAIPVLERCIREDPVTQVRLLALDNLGEIAKNLKKPCPLAILEALLDKDTDVNLKANAYSNSFSTFAPGSMELLKRCAKAENWIIRNQSLFIIVRAGAKDRKALEVIENAKRDPKFEVRHSAYMAMFSANGNLDALLPYLIRLEEEPEEVLKPLPEASETRKMETIMRDVFAPHNAEDLLGQTGKRAEELAPPLVKLLEDKSPMVRRGATRLIGACLISNDGMRFDSPKSYAGWKESLPFQFAKLNAEQRLRKLRDDDPDHSVRAVARDTLGQLASLREKRDSGARGIIQKAIKAQSGEGKVAKLRTMRIKIEGTTDLIPGQSNVPFTIEETWRMPNQFRTDISYQIVGKKVTRTQVIDGEKGWFRMDDQVTEPPKEVVADLKEQKYVDHLEPLAFLEEKGVEVSRLDEIEVEGHPALGVLANRKGYGSVKFYFDKESGLLVKRERGVAEPPTFIEVRQEDIFADYQEKNGLKHYRKFVVLRDGKKVLDAKVTDVEFMEKIDAKVFAKP